MLGGIGAPAKKASSMHVLTIANQKGGVGKSTLTSLMAFYLSEKCNGRVLAVDLDSNRNLSHTLRQFRLDIPTSSLFTDKPIQLPAVRKSIGLLHGTPQLANMDVASAAQATTRVRTFAAQIEALNDQCDYCLIDPPANLSLRTVAALASAHFAIAPIELEEYSTMSVQDTLQSILGIRAEWNPRLKFLGILANRFTHNSVRQKAALIDLMQNYKQYMLPGRISTRAAIPRALEEGIGVWNLNTTAANEASKEVLFVFDSIMERINAPNAPAGADVHG